MLIHPSSLKQFGQKVSEKHAQPCLGWFEGSYETNEGM
jgi:hypothetical protein